VAILLFVAYYVITIVGERMVRSGALEPAIGMWMGTVVMLPAAIGLTWWAAREARATGAVWKAAGRWIVARIPSGRTSKSQAS
jgi:hypothetical protein